MPRNGRRSRRARTGTTEVAGAARPRGDAVRWRDVDGILLLDKPSGLSSNRALQRVRRLLCAAKGGHAGTLDPMATGMLPLCFGQATKACGSLLGSTKAYRASVALGAATDTGDADGQVTGRQPVPAFGGGDVERAFTALRGERLQTPPMYSALKRDGRPLYELARRGESVERAPRAIRIARLDCLDFGPARIDLEVECSKGTYVRVLAEEVAAQFGTLGHLTTLRRLWVDPFREQAMVEWPALQAWGEAGGWDGGPPPGLLPVDRAFPGLPGLELDATRTLHLRQGREVPAGPLAPEEGAIARVYGPGGEFLGLATVEAGGRLRVQRLFVPGAGTQGPENS